MNPIDDYLYSQKEPYQSIMLYVRSVILKIVLNIEEKSPQLKNYNNRKQVCSILYLQ
mgnify:CR=1 FL=1